MFVCLLPKGWERGCLLIKNSPSLFLAELTALSWPSQGHSHALLHAINLWGRSRNFLSRYLVPVRPFFCVWWIQSPSKYHNFFLFHSSLTHKQTQVDRQICFYAAVLSIQALLCRTTPLLFIFSRWPKNVVLLISRSSKNTHTEKTIFRVFLQKKISAIYSTLMLLWRTFQSWACSFCFCLLITSIGCTDRLQPACKKFKDFSPRFKQKHHSARINYSV